MPAVTSTGTFLVVMTGSVPWLFRPKEPEVIVDDGPSAVVGGREQVGVDPEGEGRVGMA
jgi:hypothetical protein